MKITSIKTHKILPEKESIFDVLDRYVKTMPEKSVLAVTSKIVAICEGNVRKVGDVDKDTLIQSQSDVFLPKSQSKYKVLFTIKNNVLIASAGVDESNGGGFYVLWPKDPQKSANDIREYLVKRFSLSHVGVIITDSKTTPLRWGTTGIGIAHSGFKALNNYIEEPDIFGRHLHMTKASVLDGLSAAVVVVMGEGKEQTPLALITDVSFVVFQPRNPTAKELNELKINREDDLYAPFLNSVKWEKKNE